MSTPAQPFRERLLDFLRGGGSVAPASPPPVPDPKPAAPPPSPAQLREMFAAAQKKTGGEVHDLTGSPDPRAAVLDILRSLVAGAVEAGAGSAGRAPVAPLAAIDRDPSWDEIARRERGPGDLRALAREAGFDVHPVPVRGREDTIDFLSRAAVGITVADHAIADTGTVAQLARAFRPRSISLLPPAHLVVLPAERLLPSMGDLLARVSGELGGPAGYMTLISGPSRTADIEKVLTIGIHGPGKLVTVIVG
jgi:YkgG family uncharacterized protein